MEINELVTMLNGYFGWHKSRMDCFCKMVLALIATRTVNLAQLMNAFISKAEPVSCYKRMQRFLWNFEIDFLCLSRWVFMLFGLMDKEIYLSLDRTNWQWGKQHINILMLSIVYKGIALPIFWKLLADKKKGNSNTEDRVDVLQRFIDCFGKVKILGLLGDREFIGDEWFAYLFKENIPFFIRIRNNMVTTNSRGQVIDVDALFYDLNISESRTIRDKRRIGKQAVYLSGLRLETGELLIVASSIFTPESITIYGKRWQIETLFGCLKSKGFHFEDTHITKAERINKLLAVLTVAFVGPIK